MRNAESWPWTQYTHLNFCDSSTLDFTVNVVNRRRSERVERRVSRPQKQENVVYEPYDKETASTRDRVAWALCQIIDDDAPMRWTRYRYTADCIASNPEIMAALQELSGA